MEKQATDGTPTLNPLFFLYPSDPKTFGNELQFFYGDAILVSPVTEENATSVSIYLPDDRFYDFHTHEVVEGRGKKMELEDVDFTEIPLHIRGGTIIPMRAKSGYTTTKVRKQPFHLIVALDREGKASGSLYLDDGDSIEQDATSRIEFSYEDGELKITGTFGYQAEENAIEQITVLGGGGGGAGGNGGQRQWAKGRPSYHRGGHGGHGRKWEECGDDEVARDEATGAVTMRIAHPLTEGLTVRV